MKVLVWPADGSGCGHYRLIWPAEAAARAGLDVAVEDIAIEVTRRGARDRHGRRRVLDVAPIDADVIVTQRAMHIDLVESLEILADRGHTIVMDLDDNFHSIDPNNIAYRSHHPTFSALDNWNHLARAIAACDLVTVTTPALAARYGGHGRVIVLPNLIPDALLHLDVDRTGELLTVGWTGRVTTHPQDLQVTRGAVARAVTRSAAIFAVVGPAETAARALHLDTASTALMQSTGWVDFADYHRTVASMIDVGIVPLADTAFNRGKSGLKALEFAALGIPSVSSMTPDNARLAADGVTEIACKPKDWERRLNALLVSPGHRAEVAGRARVAAAGHTYEANGHRWADAWTLAYRSGRQEALT